MHLSTFNALQHFCHGGGTNILAFTQTLIYGRKSVDKIATQSMSKICNLWHLIVVDCGYMRFLSEGNADASHAVNIVPDDS